MSLADTTESVFIAGATGLTGRHVAQYLASLGVSTTAHVRPDSSQLDRWSKHFGQFGVSVSTAEWELESMTEALREIRPSIVFGLLGTTKKRARAGDGDYEKVDFGLTALLMDACLKMETPPLFVYLSAVGVKSDSTSAYYKARARVEAKLADSGLRSLIARPSFILGDRDDARPSERFGAPILDGLLGGLSLLGCGKLAAPYRSMTGEELASGLVQLALEWSADGIVQVPELRAAGTRCLERVSSRNQET